MQFFEGFLQRHRRLFFDGAESALIQLGGVHAPAPLHQVVRFVGEHGDAPLVAGGEAVQQRAEVEVVVVVAHHQVAPAGHFLAQVVGADAVIEGQFAQARLGQPGFFRGGGAGGGKPVVEALSERAEFAVAGFVRVFAAFVAGHQFQRAQGRRVQGFQRVQCQLAARGFGAEKKDFIQFLAGHGFEQREQGADGLADAGGRFGEQAAAGAGALVHRFRQLPLPGPEAFVGKRQTG